MDNVEIRGDELSNKILGDYLDKIYSSELEEKNKEMTVYTKKKRKILSMILKRRKYYKDYTTMYKILEEKTNSAQISDEQKKECLETGKEKIIKDLLKNEHFCTKRFISVINFLLFLPLHILHKLKLSLASFILLLITIFITYVLISKDRSCSFIIKYTPILIYFYLPYIISSIIKKVLPSKKNNKCNCQKCLLREKMNKEPRFFRIEAPYSFYTHKNNNIQDDFVGY